MKVWNNIKPITYLMLLTILSCSTPKNISYFQELGNLEEINTNKTPQIKYKPYDIISINVSATDPETAAPFNNSREAISSSNLESSNAGATDAANYLINSNGKISFPVIGDIKVSNLTNIDVETIIKNKLKPYINNPIVSVKLENFKVTVLGEVRSPGPIFIDNEQLNIIEAIGLAGDLNIQGQRENITLIRKVNNKKVAYKIDLTSKEIFNSPVYYLAQNDVIYVEPNSSRKRASLDNNWQKILTAASSVVGIILTILVITR